MIKYRKITKICVRREITPFVGITILSTHMTFILLTQVQEIIPGFGLKFTLVNVFGDMAIWSHGNWAYLMIPKR